MSIRTSIILVVSLVMIAGYVFFVQFNETIEVQDEPPWFYNVDMLDMNRIAITDREEEAVFFLGDDNRWHLDQPEGLPVGLNRWGGITLLLSGPKSRRLLNEQPTDLEPYGLDSPPGRIEMGLKDGRTISLLLGFPTPDGLGSYAQLEGSPEVFTIAAEWEQVLDRLIVETPYPEWYYNIDLPLLTLIELQTQEKTIALTKDEDGWRFDDEVQSPVDEAQLPFIIASLEKPSQTLVEYNIDDLALYGLDESSLSLSLLLRTERREGTTNFISQTLFRIGKLTEDGMGYFVQTVHDDPIMDVFMVNADWVEGLQAIVANPPYLDDTAQGS